MSSAPLVSTKQRGDLAEDLALAHLQAAGLTLVTRNYRLAGGPRVRGAEIDLILRARDGTLVFVEVRSLRRGPAGAAAGSVTRAKQQRIVRAAAHYLMNWRQLPPCRFDVVTVEAGTVCWLQAAFEAP